ncbi:MAG TPA: MBL fold metallo-hydrolase [Candidatus Limnocylindrales bacterium]|nr:MBL fold metallo-hydrolase [Candidatus Limnocylindrales bacterium]
MLLVVSGRAALAAATASLAVAVAACHQPLPVPRIEPSTDRWQQPYAGIPGMRIHAFRTGDVNSVEGAVWAGGSWTARIDMGAWAFVIEHPSRGLVVFDTGMAERAHEEPERYVGWLGARLRMLDVPERAGLSTQMRDAGLDPGNVGTVVLSHLHFDHTGDIDAFTNARVVVSRAEKEWAEAGVRATDFVDAEVLDGLARWSVVDYGTEQSLGTFIGAHDLFGDGSIFLIDLSGHTPGSQGMLVRTPEAPVLLTGDAAWTEKSWRWAAQPISAYDMGMWWEQIWRIKKFSLLEPRLIVVPGHDDKAVAAIGIASFVTHEIEQVPPKNSAAAAARGATVR